MDVPGKLFVVAAPSGAGKSTLVKALLASEPRLAVSTSHTTRPPRGQEVDGREYHFVGLADFERMIAEGAFLEHAMVHGNRYGTSRRAVEELLAQGKDMLLEIDWQGALQIRALYPRSRLVFILPPSWEALETRLRGRGEDQAEVIERRLANAREEVAQAPAFDFVIINGCLAAALSDLRDVVHQEPARLGFGRQREANPDVFAGLAL
ncbi:MAG TPA: guanylate kinase [Burkholderiaceae bacterium]|jgi:guanylate kinase|nr:guanylate kinase [Burkholderiaceae bacterium]